VSPATISELNKKAYVHMKEWRNRPLKGGKYPYVYVDGIYILAAIAVNENGYREVLGAAEGMKEDKASWLEFFQWLRGRGLEGVRLIVGDKYLGMLKVVYEVFPTPDTSAPLPISTAMCSRSFPTPKSRLWPRCSKPFMPRKARQHPA
jgi:transposase-like protein